MPTLDLKYPITKGERTVTTLVFPERVTVRHIMAGDGIEYPSIKRELAILSALTGESEIVLKELDTLDWIESQSVVNSLLSSGDNEKSKSDTDLDNKKKEK